jgi:hypothetical protein
MKLNIFTNLKNSKREKVKCVFKIDIVSLKNFEDAFTENKLIENGTEKFSVIKLLII